MKLPWRTSKGATLTCTCSIAASDIAATPVLSPGVLPNPKELLKYEPSTVMLFARESWPPNDMVPLCCGVNRVMFSRRPLIVGRLPRSSRLICVDAPVLFELNTGSVSAVTVTFS